MKTLRSARYFVCCSVLLRIAVSVSVGVPHTAIPGRRVTPQRIPSSRAHVSGVLLHRR